MKKANRALFIAALSLMFLCLTVGYAALTTTLTVNGTANTEAVEYDTLVITDVTPLSGATVDQATNFHFAPTNIRFNLTGQSGDTVVYKITVRNYSQTETYIYKGIKYASEYADVANRLSVSASADASGAQPLPNSPAAFSATGTPVAPGEEQVFYTTLTLKDTVQGGEITFNYSFDPILYSVTYLDDNDVYAVDYVTDNSKAYSVRTAGPTNPALSFAGWMNTNAVVVKTVAAGNVYDVTLSAKWDNVYLIIFADADGTVIYEERFTSSSTKLSAEGQAIVDAKLKELNDAVAGKHLSVTWSEYDIANATGDITVKAVYNYAGYLNLVPVYDASGIGVVDYYKIMAVDSLPASVVVPGNVGGVPVKVIERITNIDGESDWNNYENTVTKITIEEGVEVLGWNALAWTPNLSEVYLPSTLTQMGKNTFSRNDLFGNDKKTLTITFNGTKAEWKQVVANTEAAIKASGESGTWYGGLKKGSLVKCTDGYFELEGTFSLSWKEKSY